MNGPTSIAITGIGLATPLGIGKDGVWSALAKGRIGLTNLTLFKSPRCGVFPVGQVRDDLAALGAPRKASRGDQLAFLAAREALSCAFPDGLGNRGNRAGIALGSTVGGMLASEDCAERLVRTGSFRPGPLRRHEPAASTDLCAGTLGLAGPSATISTACSSGAMAIAMASDLIRGGEADIMLAGGADSLCRLTLNGFASLLLVDKAGCKPFDAHRAGMCLGEGAAFLVLESASSARSRGARIFAFIRGWAATCDAFQPAAPDPEGRGAARAMRNALAAAGLDAGEIDYVNAHGTGTRDNDLAEARAMLAVFQAAVPPFSSTKGFFGHALAASGAIEAAICALALNDGRAPPNPGFKTIDPSIGLAPLTEPMSGPLNHVMTNSFGFGGNNVSLILSRTQSRAAGHARARSTEKFCPVSVRAISFMSPAGNTFLEISRFGQARPLEPRLLDVRPPFPPCRVPAYACDDSGVEADLDPVRHRRLSRMLKMLLACGSRAMRDAGPPAGARDPERTAVAIGTGLGCLEDAGAFVMNLFENGERTPMPARFIQSVHNAPAGRLAIDFHAGGPNGTFTHRDISFELALWQAASALGAGSADFAMAGAGDLHDPFLLAAGRAWKWWPEDSPAIQPFSARLPAGNRPLPGEGAAVAALTRAEGSEAALAQVTAVRMGQQSLPFDSDAEARWILDALESAGRPDMILCGADGFPLHDNAFLDVARALGRQMGGPVPIAAYKHLCGAFYSASAFGFAAAVGLCSGALDPAILAWPPGGGPGHFACRRVLLLTRSHAGARALCCVETPSS
ncbi:MAG: hypothetical protein GX608_08685 [Lentisphaerae bacterium]|nr:hypothetical protein [Lentisphaerota bacterium]